MSLAAHVAGWSKDTSTKVGAVIVDSRNVLISMGWNGFPRGVNDNVAERHERPLKYSYTEHAERNAIFNAAAVGSKLQGSSMYLPWFPCSDCARAIIQSGIAKIYCYKPSGQERDKRWSDEFDVAFRMLREAGVEIYYIENGEKC